MAKINNTSTVSYQYTMPDTTVKTKTATSNLSSTENMTTSFRKTKLVSKSFGMVGDEVQITLVLANDSDAEITDIRVQDTIDEKVTFKTGTVTVDDVPYADFDPEAGFDLPNSIAKNASSTIVYTVTIDPDPTGDTFNFVSSITYSVDEIQNLQEQSNVASFDLLDATISIRKSADKSSVLPGDVVVYTNIIKNEGGVAHTNVRFSDVLPAGVTFNAGSVKVDNTTVEAYDPTTGFDLGEISPSHEVTVEFAVTVQ